jgi:hypothetical protein
MARRPGSGLGPAAAKNLDRRDRLARAAQPPQGPGLTSEAIQRAGTAGYQLHRRFPVPDHLLQPTALGNVLAAMQDSAGRAYGFDAVTARPRLYPVLGEQCLTLVDDRRDTLDASVRLAATMAATALASLTLLLGSGWWTVLALVPLGGSTSSSASLARSSRNARMARLSIRRTSR